MKPNKDKDGFRAGRKSFESILIEEMNLTQEEVSIALEASLKHDIPLGEYLVTEKRVSRKSLDHVLQSRKFDIRLGDLLVETGVIEKPSLVAQAVERQDGSGKKLGEILQALGAVDHEALMGALCLQLNILEITPEMELAHEITPMPTTAYMEKNLIVPYLNVDDAVILVMNDPFAINIREEMEMFYKGQPIIYSFANADDLDEFFTKRRALKEGFSVENAMSGSVDLRILEPVETSERNLLDSGDSVKIFEFYVKKAIDQGASDIHFEPLERFLRVRFAIDGVLGTITQLPSSVGPRILGILKASCGIDITKRNLPSDGRLMVRYKDSEFGLRVSTYPSLFGENCVLRIIRYEAAFGAIDNLGFSESNINLINKCMNSAAGVVMVTGPTGSGKTTTLYTVLRQLSHTKSQHIITIEDPIEYTLHGATQGTLNEKMGFDYPTALAAIMRQNPDIIMVGEIRDVKTAKAIVQAALTGHKVFTTFHTATAIGALTRFHAMEIEDYLINETVAMIIAQRLVRKVCNRCKEEYIPNEDALEALGLSASNLGGRAVVRGGGRIGKDRCRVCHGSGYKGQLAIHEVLFVNSDVAYALEKSKTSWEVLEVARRRASFISLKEDAVYKVLKGETTFAEIMRVLPDTAEPIRAVDRIFELCDSAAEFSACDHSTAEWGLDALRGIATSDHDNEQFLDEEKRTAKALSHAGLKLKKLFSTKLSPREQGLRTQEFQTLMNVWSDTSKQCEGPMEDNPRCIECKAVETKAAAALARANCDNCDLVVATDEHSAYFLSHDPSREDSSWKIAATIPIKNVGA